MFGEISTDMSADLVPFNQIWLLASRISKYKAPPPDMSTNTVKPHQACLLLCCICNIYARWSSATLCREQLYVAATAATTYMSAGQVLVRPLLLLNQHACRSFATPSYLPAGVVLIYLSYLQMCLLVWCLIISHACSYGAS